MYFQIQQEFLQAQRYFSIMGQRPQYFIHTSSIKTLNKYLSITKEKFVESIRRYYYPFSHSKCIKLIITKTHHVGANILFNKTVKRLQLNHVTK